MSEIALNFKKEYSPEELRKKFESITREYSLAVLESSEAGNEYPEAAENIRFLNEFIFEIDWTIYENEDDTKRVK